MNEDKLGHLTYRDLQAQNKDFSYDDYRRYVANYHLNEKLNEPLGWEAGTHIQSPIFQATEGKDYIGNSKYDQDIYREGDLNNVFDVRAENQPWLAKVGNGLAKGVLTFGTTYLQGNIGLITALAQGIANTMDDDESTKFLHGFVENPYLDMAYAISKWGEDVFPNYYSSEELKNDEEGKWWKNMASGNFIGDKILKNAGFTIGAVYSSAGISAGLSAIAKAAGIAKRAATKAVIGGVTTTLMAASEASIDANNNMKDDYLVKGNQEIETRANTDKQAIYEKYAPLFNKIDAEYEANKATLVLVDKETGQYVNPNYDKYIQKRNALTSMMKVELDAVDKASDAARQRLADTRLKVATEDFLNQFPTLLLSEGFQWGRMFANGFKTANRASHIISNGKLFGVAGTEKAANWLSQETKAAQRVRGIGKGFARGIAEMHEEIGQKIDYEIPKTYYMSDVMNFYAASMDPDAEDETMTRMNAFRDGLINTLKDSSTWEEGFLGFLPGAFGVPVFGKRFTSSNETWLGRNKAVGITGGIGGAIKENNLRLAQEKIVVDAVNKRVQEPDFVNYWQGLIRHEKYQKEMDKAVEENDKSKFEDANQAQMISDIVMFDNAGKLSDLIEFVSEITDESVENITSIVEQTTQKLNENTKYQEEMQGLANTMAAKMSHVIELEKEKEKLERQLTDEALNQPIFEYKYEPVTGESIQSSRLITDDEVQEKVVRVAELEKSTRTERQEVEDLRQQMIAKDTDAKKSIGAFVDEYGNVDDEKYIAKKIKENRDDLINTIKLYRDNKREIDSNSGTKFTNEQLSTLTWLKTHTQKWNERSKSMEQTLKENFLPQAIQFYNDLRSKDNVADKEKEDAVEKLELLNKLSSTDSMADLLLEDTKNLLDVRAIANNSAITGTNTAEILSTIADLPRIKMLSNAYTEKFNQYMQDADKLEQDMLRSRKETSEKKDRKNKKAAKKNAEKIASKMDWSSPETIVQSFDAVKEDVANMGGEKTFMENLTKEQQVLYKKARKENKLDKSVIAGIEGSDITNDSKRKLVEVYDSMDKSMDVNDKLNTIMENIDSILEKSNPDMIEDTPEQREFKANEQTKVMKALQAISDTMKEYKKSSEYVSKVEEKISTEPEERTDINPEAPIENPAKTSEEPNIQEPDDLDYNVSDQRISRREAKGFNNRSHQTIEDVYQPGDTSLPRPQITEMYLHGVNKMLYSEYLDATPSARPEMLDGYTYAQYREYIGAMEEYLHEKGAFEYVKHHLKPNDKIEFVIEEIGGQEVVIMRTPEGQVIGSLPAEIDFHYYSKYPLDYDEQGNPTSWTQTDTTLKDRDKVRYDHYRRIIDAYHRDKSTKQTQEINLEGKQSNKAIVTEEGTKLAKELSESKKDILKKYEDKLNSEPDASDERVDEIFDELYEELQLPKGLGVKHYYNENEGKFTLSGIEVNNAFGNAVTFETLNGKYLKHSVGDLIDFCEESTAYFGYVTKVDSNGHVLEAVDYTSDDHPVIVRDGKPLSREEISKQRAINARNNNADTRGKVYDTSEVNQLMGGMLSVNGASKTDDAETARARTELTVSDVFEGETPIIGIVGKGKELFLSKPSVKDSILMPYEPSLNPGQVYFFVPTNKGTYIPAKAYSRLVSEVMGTGYTDAVVEQIQKIAAAGRTTSPKLRAELEKMLRIPDTEKKSYKFKIQYYDAGKKAGQGGAVRQNPNGAAYIGVATESGSEGMFWIPITNGTVTEEDAMDFLKKLIHKYPDLSTGWDINQLTNPDYAAFMADYLVSNVNDPHSVNDFFTYKINSEEARKAEIDKTSREEAAKQEVTEATTHDAVVEVNDKEEFTFKDGTITDKDGQTVSQTRRSKMDLGIDLDGTNQGQEGERTIGLKGRFGIKPKNMEVTKETSKEKPATEKQLYQDVERLKKMFPSLSASDRVVIVDSLINSVDRNGNPVKAYGAFIDGVMYISKQSPKGTGYHESFHHLMDNLVSNSDKDLILAEAKTKYRTTDAFEAEDKLAESFRKFMNNITERGLSGMIQRTFQRLKHWVKTITNNRDAIDILFWDIYMNRPNSKVSDEVGQMIGNIAGTDNNRLDVSVYHAQLAEYANRKYGYDNLDKETREYLDMRGISKEHYEGMSYQQKEYLLHCM